MKKIHIFILTLLFINIIFFSATFADDYTRWELPEGAKFRLGKGEISAKLVNPISSIYIFTGWHAAGSDEFNWNLVIRCSNG